MPYLDWAAIVKFILPSVLYPWAPSPAAQALTPCQNLLFHLPAAFLPVSRFPWTCPSKTSLSPSLPEPRFPEPGLAGAGLDYTHFDRHPGTRTLPRLDAFPAGGEGDAALALSAGGGPTQPRWRAKGWLAACERKRRRPPGPAALLFLGCFLASGSCSSSRAPGARTVRTYPSFATPSWYDPTSVNGHVVLSGQENWRIGLGAHGRCRRSLSPERHRGAGGVFPARDHAHGPVPRRPRAQLSAARLPLQRHRLGLAGAGREDEGEEKSTREKPGDAVAAAAAPTTSSLPFAASQGLWGGLFVFVEKQEKMAHIVLKIFRTNIERRCKRGSHLATQM